MQLSSDAFGIFKAITDFPIKYRTRTENCRETPQKYSNENCPLHSTKIEQ